MRGGQIALWVALGLLLVGQRAEGKVASWTKTTKPYPGVELREGRTTDDKNDIYATLVTLCGDYVHVAATAPPTSLRTASAWATSAGAQVAVNGDFYTSGPAVYGDAVGDGKHWPLSKTGIDDSGSWYYRDNGWIAFGPGWVEFSHTKAVKQAGAAAYGWQPTKVVTTIPAGTTSLVSGFPELVIEGTQYTCSSPTASSCFPDRTDMRARHPRTAMGLTQDRRTFILAVVDGRSSRSIGMYGTELAALMHELGAYVAFNLDGGGSSQIWLESRGTINRPSDGSPRSVANHWGIFAGAATGKAKQAGSCFVAGGCYPTPVPGVGSSIFADMKPTDGGYAEAKLLKETKIASGCKSSPLMYCPKCATKRRHLLAFLVRAAKLDTSSPPAVATFSDVPKTAADYALLEAAAAAGITNGCGGGKLCPDDPVKRGAAAALIRRAAGLALVTAKSPPTFSDVPTSHMFHRAVETLKARCVATGCGAGNYCPDGTINRAKAAVWVVRAFNLDGDNTCLTPPSGGGHDAGIGDGGGTAPDADGGQPPSPSGDGLVPGGDLSSTPGGHNVDQVNGGGCRVHGARPTLPSLLLLALVVALRPRRRR